MVNTTAYEPFAVGVNAGVKTPSGAKLLLQSTHEYVTHAVFSEAIKDPVT